MCFSDRNIIQQLPEEDFQKLVNIIFSHIDKGELYFVGSRVGGWFREKSDYDCVLLKGKFKKDVFEFKNFKKEKSICHIKENKKDIVVFKNKENNFSHLGTDYEMHKKTLLYHLPFFCAKTRLFNKGVSSHIISYLEFKINFFRKKYNKEIDMDFVRHFLKWLKDKPQEFIWDEEIQEEFKTIFRRQY